MCKELLLSGTLQLEMMERILLLQLESEMDGRSSASLCHF